MKQQIILSGTGGQGVLVLTRFFADVAMALGIEVITSEIHGMAMRGGAVLSHVKVGGFKSPLVRYGMADAGLILNADNLPVHKAFMKQGGLLFVNTKERGDWNIDAAGIAQDLGSATSTNLVLLGFAVGSEGLFCSPDAARKTIRQISKGPHVDKNLRAFEKGLEAARSI